MMLDPASANHKAIQFNVTGSSGTFIPGTWQRHIYPKGETPQPPMPHEF
jgi:hypothetical protein